MFVIDFNKIKKRIIVEDNNKVIKAYKGFNKDMTCRGFQYEVGKEYETDDAVICETGFHSCENPLDVMDYYFMDDNLNITRFCEVEQYGKIDKDNDRRDTKLASSKIKIKAELKFADLVKLGVEWIKEKTFGKNDKEDSHSAKIGSSGDSAQIGSSGDYAQIGSSGDSAKIGSSGDYAQIGSSGYYAKIGSSGYYAKIGSSGDYAKIGSSGDYAKIGSSGDSAKIGSSGDSAQIGSSGDSEKIGSSGDYAKIGSSGDYAKIGSSGDRAQINSEGEDSVICCVGRDSIAKAKKGSWITLSEWKYDDKKNRYLPICVKTEQVDGERIKEDVYYKLIDGEFVEVEQ